MSFGRLNIEDLRFSHQGDEKLLFSIDKFSLKDGQSIGIKGPSGAGKTTLLHCLAGIEPPVEGVIRWGGINLCNLPMAECDRFRWKNIGMVFQDFYLIDGLSAIDNVIIPVLFHDWRASSAQLERAKNLLRMAGIDDIGKHAALLSRGERQRVAVARALLMKPSIVLADEPTASLDPENREIVGNMLIDLVKEHQSTLVLVSHETALLDKLDFQAELKDGKLHVQGEKNEL